MAAITTVGTLVEGLRADAPSLSREAVGLVSKLVSAQGEEQEALFVAFRARSGLAEGALDVAQRTVAVTYAASVLSKLGGGDGDFLDQFKSQAELKREAGSRGCAKTPKSGKKKRKAKSGVDTGGVPGTKGVSSAVSTPSNSKSRKKSRSSRKKKR